jgi:cell division protein FtsW (lipid II flippase)
MNVTYIPAADRDSHRTERLHRVGSAGGLLWVTSFVALLALALTCAGRMRALDFTGRAGDQVVNLNAVKESRELEGALGAVFTNAGDRGLAARELFRFLGASRSTGLFLPNVGAIAHATVSAKTIQATRGADVFAQRLKARTDAAAGAAPPESIPLFTAADVAILKPFFSVRTRDEFRRQLFLFGALYVLGFHVVALVWRLRRFRADYLLLSTAHLLTAIGFAALLSRPDPLRDSLLFVRYAGTTALGAVLMAVLSLVDFTAAFATLSYIPLAAALLLSALLIAFGTGPGTSSARVNLGPLQPIEAIRLLLALFLAGYFARRWEVLRDVRGGAIRRLQLPAWLDLPRGEYVLPVFTGVGAALVFFFFQKDLGPALFLCCVFLAVYAVARGRVGMAIAGLTLLASGFYLGYRLHVSATLADRVRMWQSPWDNTVAGGNQVTQAIWGMATGGVFGTGLGLGDSRYLPAGHTDLILAAIGEELGFAGILVVAAAFSVLAWRGFRIARRAPGDYGFFLATSLTLFLVVPVLIMAAGVMGVTPLTGVVTPFLSYGGSAMLANFAALGILNAIASGSRPPGDFEPFRVPLTWLGGVLATCALALVCIAARVQVLSADSFVVRPHLGVQADGARRFEYNPRILDVLSRIPRGSIYDRKGLPLATEDAAALDQARPQYARLGISLAEACPGAGERCYPLGGRAFHVLGDVRTRVNWTASNTSYVERDAANRLRGFDDHASNVRTTDGAGRAVYTLDRDYRDLVPLLRHRYEPDHPAVVALQNQPRDVRLTLDTNLQLRVSAIVAEYARKADGRAAAVVLDPDTGAVLASASYPWPSVGDDPSPLSAQIGDALLDRARYGAYPPGSTFKLVVALAALRQNPDLSATTYMCERLPGGRVGASIPGWTRPVRDDVLDTQPHGTINMHDGFVRSCNAYFAQLAVHLGPEPLVSLAGRLRIPLVRDTANSLSRVRATIPQVGYGQAEVVASPLRMASAAAAIAAGGVLHEPYVEQKLAGQAPAVRIADPGAARQLGSYMRDVVLTGTGRSLRTHSGQIAGKTGTAEVANAPSHGWFVGFAPYGPATRRIAFAIIVEHAGYGGATAAPAVGEIVTAAAAAGLIEKRPLASARSEAAGLSEK